MCKRFQARRREGPPPRRCRNEGRLHRRCRGFRYRPYRPRRQDIRSRLLNTRQARCHGQRAPSLPQAVRQRCHRGLRPTPCRSAGRPPANRTCPPTQCRGGEHRRGNDFLRGYQRRKRRKRRQPRSAGSLATVRVEQISSLRATKPDGSSSVPYWKREAVTMREGVATMRTNARTR